MELYTRRLEEQWRHRSSGPTTKEDLEQWVAQLLSRFDSVQRDGIRKFFIEAAAITTAYSGCGFFENLISQICLHLNISPPRCVAAWEVNAKARVALHGSGCPMAPAHIFGNLLGVYPKPVVRKMFKVQRTLSREWRSMINAGVFMHRRMMEEKGCELLTALDGLLAGQVPASSAWCYTHKRFCRIPTPVQDGGLCLHCAGTTCVDFSARSTTRAKVMGQHMVPFASWAWARKAHLEHLILHECVVQHPSSMLLKRYLEAIYVLQLRASRSLYVSDD